MGASKPCLGYPSRTAAALALKAEGLSHKEIGRKIGIPTGTVASLVINSKQYRKHQKPVAGPDAEKVSASVNDLFPLHQRELARRHAAKRNTTVQRLIQMIVEKVLIDDIVDAVLDDAAEGGCA